MPSTQSVKFLMILVLGVAPACQQRRDNPRTIPEVKLEEDEPAPTLDVETAQHHLVSSLEKRDIAMPPNDADFIMLLLVDPVRIQGLRTNQPVAEADQFTIGEFCLCPALKRFSLIVAYEDGLKCDILGTFFFEKNQWRTRVDSLTYGHGPPRFDKRARR